MNFNRVMVPVGGSHKLIVDGMSLDDSKAWHPVVDFLVFHDSDGVYPQFAYVTVTTTPPMTQEKVVNPGPTTSQD